MQTQFRHTVNCPVSLSYPTCVTWTGFSGAEILTPLERGEPKTLPMKDDIPLFFFHVDEILLASSEYLLDDEVDEASPSGGVALIELSPIEKLADWRRAGLIIFAFGVV